MVLASVSGVCSPVAAQEDISLGVLGLYGLNTHRADFRALPGVPNCCPSFQSGSGAGLALALLGRLPLSSALRGEVRLGYTDLSGTLLRREQTTVSGNVPGVFEHQVDSRLTAITLEPLIGVQLLSGLYGYVGARVGMSMASRYDQKETIVEPSAGTFPNGRRTQNEQTDAQIPEAATIGGALTAGLQLDLPMNADGSLKLVPDVSYAYGLTSVVSSLKWNVDQLRIGASIVWTPTRKSEAPKPERIRRFKQEQRIDTITIAVAPAEVGFVKGAEQTTETTEESATEVILTTVMRRTDTLRRARTSKIDAAIMASGVNADGTESSSFVINVEEFASIMMNPLLSYVFFEEGQSALPERYRRLDPSQTSAFSEEYVNSSDKLPTYYHLLNIVGSRLRRKPKATVTLIGCNADVGLEASNLKLSSQRAEELRRYLNEVWGISPQRIRTQSRNLPEKAANSQTLDGVQENRRVEIVPDDLSVVAPVITRDTVRSITPPSVRLRPSVKAERPITQWKVELRQGEGILKTFEGSGTPPSMLDWNVQQEQGSHPRRDMPIEYQFIAIDEDGNRAEANGKLDVRLLTITNKRTERIADKEIDRFSLILFDVRSAELSASNAAIIDLIKPYVRPSSQVTLTGLTDRLGNAAQNQALAEQRARSAAKALGVAATGAVRGIGNATSYTPELPEGRLYTRTVDIVIETPVTP